MTCTCTSSKGASLSLQGESTIHLFDQVPLDTRSEASDPIAVSSQLIDVVALDESNFGLVSLSAANMK